MTLEKFFILHYPNRGGTRNRNNRMGDIVVTIKSEGSTKTDAFDKDVCIGSDPIGADNVDNTDTGINITTVSETGIHYSSRTTH